MDGPIGLVLSGGGAKGAYQAGVWKAMCELGVANQVAAISGTSVGAINAAGFAALKDPGKVCRVWREHVGEMASTNLRALSVEALFEGVRNLVDGKAFPFHGLLDREALERLVRRLLPGRWPTSAPTVFTTALECRARGGEELSASAYALRRFRLEREDDPDIRTKKLLASAAIPWGFDPVEIEGRRYVDGGWDVQGGDNVPLAPILEHCPDIRTLVVVRCNSAEVEPEGTCPPCMAGRDIVEIRPRITLPGIFKELLSLLPDSPVTRQLLIWSGTFAFDREYAEQFIRQGWTDGMNALRGLRPREKLQW